MTKLNWAIVCCLVIFNSAAVVASMNERMNYPTGADARCNDDCAIASKTIYECNHSDMTDTTLNCESYRCIENILFYARCTGGAENERDCEFKYDPNFVWVVQRLRTTPGCITTIGAYTISAGDCEGFEDIPVKCTTSVCSGQVVEGPYSRTKDNVCK